MDEKMGMVTGRRVLEVLAKTYQQLYLAPGDLGVHRYGDIVKKGKEAEKKTLSHFICSGGDRLEFEHTPAGEVCIITLYERADFETFLRIMANRCEIVEIPKTQGASIIDGVINWEKIRKHKAEFMKGSSESGGISLDWNAEFKDFTSRRENFKDALIVLSVGAYSGIPASRLGFTDKEWLAYSSTIRRYHECTHFICRRLYPEKTDAVWDELVADAVGIYAAFGMFDRAMEELFFGISENGFSGGRLENYMDTAQGRVDGRKGLDELAMKAHRVLLQFSDMAEECKGLHPFDLARRLENGKDELWDRTEQQKGC